MNLMNFMSLPEIRKFGFHEFHDLAEIPEIRVP